MITVYGFSSRASQASHAREFLIYSALYVSVKINLHFRNNMYTFALMLYGAVCILSG